MGKSNNGQLIILGAIGLAAVYLLTKRQSTNTGSTYYPTQPPPTTTTTQQNQLLQWAQTQASATTITNIIKSLDWAGIADMWSKLFGSGSSSQDYSGGGTDVPDNPYSEYDPYNYNDPSIWA